MDSLKNLGEGSIAAGVVVMAWELVKKLFNRQERDLDSLRSQMDKLKEHGLVTETACRDRTAQLLGRIEAIGEKTERSISEVHSRVNALSTVVAQNQKEVLTLLLEIKNGGRRDG